MKKGRWKIVCLLLACVVAHTFVGCDLGERSIEQKGISITEENAYTAETQAYAEQTFYDLLAHYAKKSVGENLPNATVNTLKAQATGIKDETCKTRVEESLYITLLDELNEKGKGVIDEIVARSASGEQSLEKTEELYLSLSSFLGADYVSSLCYKLCVYVYDYKYENAMEDYETYGYEFLLEDAQAIKAERDVLVNDVGESNFLAVIKNTFALSRLLLGEELNSERLTTFTDLEILTFIKGIDLSSIDIGENGWKWLLEKGIGENVGEDAAYFVRLAWEMKKNGDIEEIKTVMNDLVDLLAFSIENLKESDVALLRGKDYREMLRVAFERFGQSEWETFERVSACDIKKENYDLIATERFGQAYIEYKSTVQTFTLAQLKDAVTQEGFYATLKGYIAGISPAFAYGIEE